MKLFDAIARPFRRAAKPDRALAKTRAKTEGVLLLGAFDFDRAQLGPDLEHHAEASDAALHETRMPMVVAGSGRADLAAIRAAARRLSVARGIAGEAVGKVRVFRRDALLQAGGLDAMETMRKLGWRMVGETRAVPVLDGGEATLFLSLSGRHWAWPLTRAFLETQTFPRERTRLHILDTSGDAAFSSEVRAWLAGCGYATAEFFHDRVGPAGLADQLRPDALEAVRHAVARIYNRFAQACRTPLVFFLEDDVIPSPDAFTRLAELVKNGADSASGIVRGRHEKYRRGAAIAWRWRQDGTREPLAQDGGGVEEIGGSGFGCVAMRGDIVAAHVFRSGPPQQDFDFNFFHDIVREDGARALLDWGCVCRHHDSAERWV